jgi:phenylalanyl-tRNA synthetase beta chain
MSGLGAGAPLLDPWTSEPLGHPGRCAHVAIAGREAGVLMELHPSIADSLELPRRVALCELDAEVLFAGASESAAVVPPRFPPVARDVALVVPEVTPAADVEALLREAAGPLLDSIVLFDVYRGTPLPEGSASLAFSLALRDLSRTLTDEDADGVMRAIADAATSAGWSIRE